MAQAVESATQAQAWIEEEVGGPFPNSLDEDVLNQPLKLDLSQAELSNLIPAGRYAVKITDIQPKVSDKGNSYTEMKFQVTAGPLKNRTIVDRFMHAGNPVVRIIHLMDALGMLTQSVEDTIKSKQVPNIAPAKFRDRYLWVTVVHRNETYQGETRPKAVISWTGFEEINKFAPPADNDPFAEAGDTK